jgi:DNA-binding transcriptional regulator YbjK
VTARTHRASGQARRDALLRATVEVTAARGFAGVTHRAVTEQAGVPLATVSYFFDSIDDLAAESLRVFAAEHVAQMTAVAQALEESSSSPGEIADAFAAIAASDRTATLAMFEAYLVAVRHPSLADEVRAARRSFTAVAAAAARAAGAVDPDSLARALVAVADGFALHHLGDDDQGWRDEVRSAIEAIFLGDLVIRGRIDDAVVLASSKP